VADAAPALVTERRGLEQLIDIAVPRPPITTPPVMGSARCVNGSKGSRVLAIAPIEKVGGLVTVTLIETLLVLRQQVHGLEIARWVVDLRL
jgi:hypothetical protein